MEWLPAKQWLNGFSLEMEKPTTELRIVNPNDILKQSSLEALGSSFSPNARLAWVVEYPIRYTGPKLEGGGIPIAGKGILEVWIDAENGKFLGGTF